MIEAAAPKDEIEGALAVQMACTHTATMAVLARLGGGHGSEQRVAALGSAAARLLRAYATQVEVLRRLRHGGQQYVRVEHIYINDGGTAVIGNVEQPEISPMMNDSSRGLQITKEEASGLEVKLAAVRETLETNTTC